MPERAAETSRYGMLVLFGVGEYQMRLARGARAAFQHHGVPLLVYAEDASVPGVSELLVRLLRDHTPFGVITSPATVAAEQERLLELLDMVKIPVVHVGQKLPDALNVCCDSEAGMRALMAHVLDECGAKRPALVRGIVDQPDSIERERVFRAEMARRNLTVDEELVVTGHYTHDRGYHAVRKLLLRRRDMDAVVALNDESAFGALDALAEAGLRVPDDIIVTGFDDERIAAMRAPGLTTVSQDVEGVAALASAALIAAMPGAPRPVDLTSPSNLVVRGTTGGTFSGPGDAGDALVEANHLLWSNLAIQETLLALNRTMFRCRTIDDVTAALTTCTNRLGITRCRLAVYDPPATGHSPQGPGGKVRLVLDRAGPDATLPEERTSVSAVLDELGKDPVTPTILMPLSGLDHDLGFIAFDQPDGAGSVVEMLGHDLSRALESVFGSQERDRYTANLERLVAQRTHNLELANSKLERLARLDGLTRIANRSAFEHQLQLEWTGHMSTRRQLALLMADVDYFKAYNDHYGHVPGDEALRTVASCLERAARRPHDLAARYGGEEFVLLLPDTGVDAALVIARRFQRLLAEAAIPHAASGAAAVVTASIGIAAMRASVGEEPQALVYAADRTLYRAKRSGRNRIAVNSPDGTADIARQQVHAGDPLG